MISLSKAIDQAEDRKVAVMGESPGLHFSPSEEHDRLVFSGLDIDYDELQQVGLSVSRYFHGQSAGVPLLPLFAAAWVDGLLIGLLAAQQKESNT